MAELKLLRGQIAIVDDEDLPRVSGHKWYVDSEGYVAATINKRKVLLHRLILGSPTDLLTDHKHHDLLDCRKYQLRQATGHQNQGNRRKLAETSSRFKGVSWCSRTKKWVASIGADSNGKHRVLFLGRFTDEIEAAKAYNAAALKHFGNFAYLNRI